MPYLVILVILILIEAPAMASVWHVDREGMGDFLEIQAAVERAASGDTIFVGPGRYLKLTETCIDSPDSAHIVLNKNLTIIGSGAAETVIGPINPWHISEPVVAGVLVSNCGNNTFHLEGLGIENIYVGILGSSEGTFGSIKNCAISGHGYGFFLAADNIQIEHCQFYPTTDQFPEPSGITYVGSGVCEIVDCSFLGSFDDIKRPVKIINNGSGQMNVRSCMFSGGGAAVWARGGSTRLFECTIFDYSVCGMAVGSGTLSAADCFVRNVGVGVKETDAFNHLEIERCFFEDVVTATYQSIGLTSGYFHDNVLAKGERYVAFIPPGDKDDSMREEYTFDMTDNWWGTDNPDTIRAWIKDVDDYPEYPFYPRFVFEPFKTNPVSTEKHSLEAVKSMFR